MSERDVERTAFTPFLEELLHRVPAIEFVTLVDLDGETVDYAGRCPPFDIRVTAAHLRIALHQMTAVAAFRGARDVVIATGRATFALSLLADDYVLVVKYARRAGIRLATRAIAACILQLGNEAGWSRDPARARWSGIQVRCDERGRPSALRGLEPERDEELQILGNIVGLARGERGYRIRLRGGLECSLVRERNGQWFADDSDGGHARAGARK